MEHMPGSYREIAKLAVPLALNSGLQALINLTDAWFIGRISAEALAAVGGVYWLLMGTFFLFGGVGFAVQAFAAQAFGGQRPRRAARACWAAIWFALGTTPVFLALGLAGQPIISLLALPISITDLSVEFWGPRMIGGPAVVALWAISSFFMGVGHVRAALVINVLILLTNAVLNALLVFGLKLGLSGSGWATSLSLYVGLALALSIFLSARYRIDFLSHRVWRFHMASVLSIIKVGGPTGAWIASDLLGLAAFQAMMSRIGVIDGAATQIVMMLTSVAFMPAIGVGMAGTTLVGQMIGAGNSSGAYAVGNKVIVICAAYMFLIGIALALSGSWLIPLFVKLGDPDATRIVELGVTLLWIAAGYQLFDGLNLGSGFCLRAAGDTKYPAGVLIGLSFFLFIPLVHTLSFTAGQGWIKGAPAVGLGAVGGWLAAVVYISTLGMALTVRWRLQCWRSMRLG